MCSFFLQGLLWSKIEQKIDLFKVLMKIKQIFIICSFKTLFFKLFLVFGKTQTFPALVEWS